MSKKQNNESKEQIDESKFDWTGFEDMFWENYQAALKKGIPPELEGDSIAEEFEDFLCK
jgi:hypothetical protein